MVTVEIEKSSSVAESCDRFLDDIEAWAKEGMRAHAVTQDSHDQGSYTLAWEPLLLYRSRPRHRQFLRDLRDRIKEHFSQTGKWHHGYWRFQEAHHGTEHFELFLGFLFRIDPDDSETRAQLVDAAEHIGNWVADVPSWFDWESGLFRSMYFGTARVSADPAHRMNVADHMRCVNMARLAYHMTADPRYLDLAVLHAGRWVDAMLAQGCVIAGLLADGPVVSLSRDDSTTVSYHGFAGMAGDLGNRVDRAENLLASGAVDAFLDLWQITRKPRFLEGVHLLLDDLVTQLSDPDCGVVAQALRLYRDTTDSDRYDGPIREALTGHAAEKIQSVGVCPQLREGAREHGVGKRRDKPAWFENGHPRRINPILLSLLAEIEKDEVLAIQCVDLARAYFLAARKGLTGNQFHGCGASTAAAVARGHGRENNAGVSTAVLLPIMKVFL